MVEKYFILMITHSRMFPCFSEFQYCWIRLATIFSGTQFYPPNTANHPNTQPSSGCTSNTKYPNSESATQTQISSTQLIGNPCWDLSTCLQCSSRVDCTKLMANAQTVVDTLASSRLNQSSLCNPITTATDAKARKIEKYRELLDNGCIF